MKVQDLWEMYDRGISPFEIENTCKSELICDKTLAEAMADIWIGYGFLLE